MDRDRPRHAYNNRAPPAPAPAPPTRARPLRIDRDKTCPFLLRAFVKSHGHHLDSDFAVDRLPSADEHQLYLWRDSTIRDLLVLLRDATPSLRTNPLARYSVRLVYFDAGRDRFASRELATVSAREVVHSPNPDRTTAADKTLDDARFVIGDYLSVAFHPGSAPLVPNPSGPYAERSVGGGGGPRGSFGFSGSRGNDRVGAGPPPVERDGPTRAEDAWGKPADVRGPIPGASGWGGRGGGGMGGGGGRGGGSMGDRGFNTSKPADSGWSRRASHGEDNNSRPRRSSRSASPARRNRSRSPPPHQRGGRDNDARN